MSEEKQIEEMAKIICAKCKSDTGCERVICTMAYREAEALYEKGYRKASDVASEIIAILKSVGIDEWRYPVIAELKKMYLEEVK